MQNLISIANIQQHQFVDPPLNQIRQQQPLKYPIKIIQDRPLICYRKYIDDNKSVWRIAIPTVLIEPTVRWYHEVLGHCGTNRLYDTMRQHIYSPNMKQLYENHRYETCQKNKLLGAGYGHLPPRHASLVPWNEVMVDLIGPWKVNIQD